MMGNISPAKRELTSAQRRALLAQLLREKADAPDIFPLSFAQQRLWFLDQWMPGNAFSTVLANVRMAGKLDREALERSLNRIVERHTSLRTTFVLQEGEPVQLISPTLSIPLPIQDLSSIAVSEREALVQEQAHEEAQRPFDLARGPLLRATLLRLHPGEHILLLSIHHIVFDGWSLELFMQELSSLYEAYSSGHPPSLPEVQTHYTDYTIWQRHRLEGPELTQQLNYWKQQLTHLPVLQLPTDYSRPASQTFRGALLSRPLTRSLGERLKRFSQREDVTLFMTLLAAFQILLARYSGQEDIVVGTPSANRSRSEFEKTIGFFVNMLVLRSDLSGNPSFRQVLQRVRQMALDAYSHQEVPFEKLVEELAPEREQDRNPLFQVMFALQDVSLADLRLAGLSLQPFEVHSGTAKFDLSLVVTNKADGLVCSVEYSTDLFAEATIVRMLDHFQVLLEGIIANPEQHIADLPLLTQMERHLVLTDWNATRGKYPQEQSLHQLFEQQVQQTPDAIAVVSAGTDYLTYSQLDKLSDQLARYLQELGVRAEIPVGLCVERSLDLVVGLLGILKAGGAYVPLDPAYPQERLAFMLRDAHAPVLVTQQPLLAKIPASEAITVCLDADRERIASQSQEHPASEALADNLAYVIYTSGSTGKPKGTLVSHRGLCNLVQAQRRIFQLAPEDHILQFASLSFDASIWEIILALPAGAKLFIDRPDMLRPGPDLLKVLHDYAITTVTFPPSALAALPATDLAHLRTIITAGEACTPDLVAHWATGRRFFNAYGPTETTVCATVAECPGADWRPHIGRPILNTRVYLLDARYHPVPAGVFGEVYIGGEGLARGYVNRPELTAERFIPDQFSGEPGARLYRTGDLARYLPDGNIEFLGRIDHQVKIRGFRIEPGEIEALLSLHPAIQEVVIVADEITPGDKRLVAYIVVRAQQAVAISDLRHFLQERLPSYMVPSFFIKLDALPRLPNGKIDRSALRVPDEPGRETENAGVAPRTLTEEVMAGIWAKALGVKQISVHDNFFEVGGHSLLAAQIIARVRDIMQVDVPLRAIFEEPTIAALSRSIDTMLEGEHMSMEPAILPLSHEGNRPLSFAQQRLWLLHQLQPGNPSYNVPAVLCLTGPLHREALECSLHEVVQRHEALRTTLVMGADGPYQRVIPALALPLITVDLTTLPQSEQEDALRQFIAEEVRYHFDLAQGPLIRAHLLQLQPERHVLCLNTHHSVFDGWSFRVLLQELTECYRAYAAGSSPELAALPVQYADFALWQRQWLSGETLETQLAYWKRQLQNAPVVLPLPTNHPRPPVQTFNGRHLSFALPPSLLAALTEFSRHEEATLFMTLLTAFLALLARISGQEDIVVGTPVANRSQVQLEELIGCFVNTLALRVDLAGNPSLRQLLLKVRQTALQAYAHQHLPFEQLVDALSIERHLSHSPLIQVMFVFDAVPQETLEAAGIEFSPMEIESGVAKFDLTLALARTVDGLKGVVEYNTDLFKTDTIRRFVGYFHLLLEAMVANPEQPLYALPLLSEAELHQQLVEWNATSQAYPQERLIHQLIEAQCEQFPDAPALVDAERQISYRILNQRANQLAHFLRQQGAGPETPIGVCLERSIDLVVAQLAILKAGATYIPLDPAYPAIRLAFILSDAQAALLLTQRRFAAIIADALLACQVEQPVDIVCLDEEVQALAQQSDENLPCMIASERLAYIIYTSGSTGLPKGVSVTHRGLLNLIFWHQQAFEVSRQDRASFVAGLGFDASVWELWPYLACGACLYLPDEQTRLSPELLQAWILDRQISIAFVSTPLAERMLSLSWPPGTPLRCLLTGGDRLHCYPGPDLPFMLINNYGPTENTVVATSGRLPTQAVFSEENGPPIGRPIANVQTYVLDTYQRPVPGGTVGELYLGGDSLARGYHRRPELTAERFIPHPFSKEPGARLYRTGDLVRYQPDGQLEFLGRNDQQVKIRGVRIELGEIEAILNQHQGVREAVVLVREESPGMQQLVAYVVPQEDRALSVTELRQLLQQRLPEQMLPRAFVQMDALPLTAHGKVDRQALPAPDPTSAGSQEPYVAPRSRLEGTIAAIWQQVLQREKVGLYDNFFELGGHSLLLTQVHTHLQTALQRAIPLINLFQYPTISSLALSLKEEQHQPPAGQHSDERAQKLEQGKNLLKQRLQRKQQLKESK